jgi:hypothetical protein
MNVEVIVTVISRSLLFSLTTTTAETADEPEEQLVVQVDGL